MLELIDRVFGKQSEEVEEKLEVEVEVETEVVEEPKKRGAKTKHGLGSQPTREQLKAFAKEGKANLNTDDWWVICATTGMSQNNARRIVAYRNKMGKFKRVKDLMNVDFVKASFIEKYGPMLEV